MAPAMHFTACDHVNPSDPLLEDGRLASTQLGIAEIAFCQLAKSD